MPDTRLHSGAPAWRWLAIAAALVLGWFILTTPAAESSLDELMQQAGNAFREGDLELAVSLASRAVEAEPRNAGTWYLRGRMRSEQRRFDEALKDLNEAVRLAPLAAPVLHDRGEVRFALGDVEGAMGDFDRFVGLEPRSAAHHWQRGITCYYTGRFEEGRRQFERHRTVNPNDVENAVWHFLCVARGEGLEEAREGFMAIEGDRRIPMREIHRLFSGKGSVEDVLGAARAGDPVVASLRTRLFYGHLYVGLYYEAMGQANLAREHMLKAAGPFGQPHFMGDVARVHLKVRGWAEKEAEKPTEPASAAP
jgi:lipoprotein NlpI